MSDVSAPERAKTSKESKLVKQASEDIRARTVTAVSLEQRQQMVREAAYFRAQSRDFADGFEEHDWLAAEADVNSRLATKR